MAQLTSTGLTIRRFPEIKKAVEDAIQEDTSTAFSFDPDLILGHIISILSAEFTVYEETLQSLNDALDRDKAGGTSLDVLLNLVGLKRISASNTSGDLSFTTGNDVTIPIGYVAENPSTGDKYVTTISSLNSIGSCTRAVFTVGTLPVSTLITLSVNGVNYNYTTDANPTELEVVTALALAIENDTNATWSGSINTSGDPELVISSDSSTPISIVVLQYLSPLTVTSLVPAEASVSGALRAPPLTITEGVSSLSSLISVTNLLEFGVGRKIETDIEFRVRASKSLAVSGSATYAAMLAAMLNLDEITSVVVEENASNTTGGTGIPAHAFEVVVTAPATVEVDTLIAETIWLNKPIGIQSHGNTSVSFVDSTGAPRDISFSRPVSLFIAVRVTYTLYDEEPFNSATDSIIREFITSYGNALPSGKDIILKRFYNSIYDAVDGLDDIVIEAQVVASSGATPAGGSWSTAKIPVSATQHATFSLADVYAVGP